MPTFDFDDLTALSESSPRQGDYDTLQWHHTVTTTYEAARSLMDAGGRTVSANGLMTADGRLGRVVDPSRRAFTSASTFDHRSLTVECVNTSGGPEYGLSDATHQRLGKTLAEMVQEGRSQVIYGPGGLLQHKDVPGSYATACAGPSADSDRVLAYATAYLNAQKPKARTKVPFNIVKKSTLSSGNPVFGSTQYATLGELVNPVQLWVRQSTTDDLGPVFAAAYGGATPVSDKVWADLIVRYTPGESAGVATTVALSAADRALLTGLSAAIAALPAEIDRYADGRKQAS